MRTTSHTMNTMNTMNGNMDVNDMHVEDPFNFGCPGDFLPKKKPERIWVRDFTGGKYPQTDGQNFAPCSTGHQPKSTT